MFRLVTAAACAALIAAPALADAPVALVENAAGKPGVKAMELLSEGQILILQQGASVTLGYFGSCQRETITGGTVVVGPTESAVFGGSVRREKVACDGGRMLRSADQNISAAVSLGRPRVAHDVDAQFILYNRAPLLEVKGPGDLVIQRLDKAAGDLRMTITADRLEKGHLFDLAKAKAELDAGGVYLISGDDKGVVVKVADGSTNEGPLFSRLIRLY